jgi:hypothetical protein
MRAIEIMAEELGLKERKGRLGDVCDDGEGDKRQTRLGWQGERNKNKNVLFQNII